MGPWLDLPADQVFKDFDREIKQQEPAAKNRLILQRVYQYWREGNYWAKAKGFDKIQNYGVVKLWLPDGTADLPPIPNKADDLCNKIVAQVTADPVVLEAEPASPAEEDRSSAEFATRFLQVDGDESGTNDVILSQRVLDAGCTRATAFVHDYVHPAGGGWRPKEIMAPQEATAVGPDGQPLPAEPDPTSGMVAPPTAPVKRYVTKDGQIVDDALQADRQWQPKICASVLYPEHVRFLPELSDGIDDADGVILLDYAPLSEIRASCSDVLKAMKPEDVRALAKWKPPRHTDLVPPELLQSVNQDPKPTGKNDDEVPGDTIIFFYHGYRKSSMTYPEGANVMISGANNGVFLYQQPWSAVVDRPDGTQTKECLAIPLAQCKQLSSDTSHDAWGRAIIGRFGAGNKMRASIFGSVLNAVDKILHPHVFLASTSPVQPRQLARRDDTPIPVTNVAEDKPFYEPPPILDANLVETTLARIDTDMNSASGLQQSAQGTEIPSVNSGIQAQTIIEQSKVAIGQIFQNYLSFCKRHGRIKLQLARAFLTNTQRLSYVSEDNQYQEEEWTGSDLFGARNVTIKKGSGTMMSFSAKMQMAQQLQQFQWLDPEKAKDLIAGGVSPMLGLQDEPARNYVRGQLRIWKKGPPQGWAPPQQSLDPATGQPVMSPSFTPFTPRPIDEDPYVAKIRYREIRDLVASTMFTKFDPNWQALLAEECQKAQSAAGVVSVQQQSQIPNKEVSAAKESEAKARLAQLQGDATIITAQAGLHQINASDPALQQGTQPGAGAASAGPPTSSASSGPSAAPPVSAPTPLPSGPVPGLSHIPKIGGSMSPPQLPTPPLDPNMQQGPAPEPEEPLDLSPITDQIQGLTTAIMQLVAHQTAQPPLVVAQPDLAGLTQAITDLRGVPPQIHVLPPPPPADVHVHVEPTPVSIQTPKPQVTVNVPAQQVHLPAPHDPIVNVAAPKAPDVNVTVERPKSKRKMTGSLGGKPFEVTVDDEK